MVTTLVLASALFAGSQEVDLSRVFTKGRKVSYDVSNYLMIEQKSADMDFYLPFEQEIRYRFTSEVLEARQDGFALISYSRPTVTQIDGETSESPPKSKVEKVGMLLKMTLSPINEITDIVDLSPKKDKDNNNNGIHRVFGKFGISIDQEGFIGNMISEVQRMAIFYGNLQSSLDLSPRLPLDTINKGDTWKTTVGYQPAALKGTDKQAMQRIDYTLTYEGVVEAESKKVHRIVGKMSLATDAAKFLHQASGLKPDQTGLKELRLKLNATLTYDLDLKSKETIRIEGESKGGFQIVTTQDPDSVAIEQKLTGKARMVRVGS